MGSRDHDRLSLNLEDPVTPTILPKRFSMPSNFPNVAGIALRLACFRPSCCLSPDPAQGADLPSWLAAMHLRPVKILRPPCCRTVEGRPLSEVRPL